METQYYTLIEKQDFFEIIENKYGELAIFIDARSGLPDNPVLEFDGKKTALLKRDAHLAVKLDNINVETVEPLAESEFVMIVELKGKMVERVYGVPVENVEEIVFEFPFAVGMQAFPHTSTFFHIITHNTAPVNANHNPSATDTVK